MNAESMAKHRRRENREHAPAVKSDGTLRVAPFDLPLSGFLDAKSRSAVQQWMAWNADLARNCPGRWTDPKVIPAYREFLEKHFFPAPIARLRALYDVRVEARRIAGVHTEIISPVQGVSACNEGRVLINLHGGGFTVGARLNGQLESIPVAATGRIKVISVDYRMAPEHRYPAATEDVVAVYRKLLETYPPGNIGLYGCSAGGVLAAQTVARLLTEGLPLPGGVGMLCGGGSYWSEGDSAHLGAALTGEPVVSFREHPYFRGVDGNDPLAFPVHSPALLAKFPPSLFIAATRDWVMSSVVHMHSRLVASGIQADLHVWEGLGHAFFYDPDLPQSQEAHDVTVRFFNRHLGCKDR